LIQPDGDIAPMVPGGAPTSKRLFKFFLGMINIGGTKPQQALTHTTVVIFLC